MSPSWSDWFVDAAQRATRGRVGSICVAALGVIGTLVLMSGPSAGASADRSAAPDRIGNVASSHYAACNWVGQIMLVGFDFAPVGTQPAQGQLLPIASNNKLYSLLGNQFGGSASNGTYGLPNLRGKAPTGLHYVICTKTGAFPARKSADRLATSVAQTSAASSVASSSAYGGSCNYLGQVVLVPFAFSFHGTVAARGELLPTSMYHGLFLILGYTFGRSSDGQMFGVPDLRGRAPGGLHYRICTSGAYPSSQRPSSPWCNWLGQIILSTFNVSLRGTSAARGQTLPILQNEALFTLFSNKFGGSRSANTFGLPDLRGKAPPGLHYRVCNSGAFPSRN